MLQLVVAEKLGLTLAELAERMTIEELQLWSLFYEIRHEDEKKVDGGSAASASVGWANAAQGSWHRPLGWILFFAPLGPTSSKV